MSGRYAEVAVPPPVARQLTYRFPDEAGSDIGPGALVLVPVGPRLLTGVVVAVTDQPPAGVSARAGAIREVAEVLDDQALPIELLDLCRWAAGYYFAPLGAALMAALPPGLHRASGVALTWRPETTLPAAATATERRLATALASGKPMALRTLRRRLGATGLASSIRRLKAAGCLSAQLELRGARVALSREPWWRLALPEQAEALIEARADRAPRQAECLRLLLQHPEGRSRRDLTAAGVSPAVLAALSRLGLLERLERTAVRDPLSHLPDRAPVALAPTSEQQQVIAALAADLDRGAFRAVLLHGVTGSGKTLVYIQLVARALEQGRGAIVLVPEIALAWQMVRRFREHFGSAVAVLHSQLSVGERYDTWTRLRRGEQRVIIGARSAVLAPMQRLGLVIVDEEHDSAYKQDDLDSHFPFPYNARDVALVRGQQQRALVLLGSATPSLESYWHAQAGKYSLHSLPHRVDDRPLPVVTVVDLRREPGHARQGVIFSHVLRTKMHQRLERGEQIVLLQNRRGFAPLVLCGSCGEAVQCTRCRVSTTYHRGGHPEVRCHYCDYRAPVPTVCAHCGSAELRFQGIGTQKVETALTEQFPGVRVIRMDVDTTGWKGAHDAMVERFRDGGADVLLGTQMVAKGLDFPGVTLVGVVCADTGMHMPDFRAAERSFQLLTQVAGRSGRGDTPGEVVIQTSLPDDRVLQTAAAQDFPAFAAGELAERRPTGFPPFGRLIVFRWRGEDEAEVTAAAARGVACLQRQCQDGLAVLGPAAAPLALLRGEHRWQALLRGTAAPQLHQAAAAALPDLRAQCSAGVSLTVNVDPSSMM